LNSQVTYLWTGLTQGFSYDFKVVAVNKHGQSEDSPVVVIKASGIPSTMAAPTV